MSVAVNQSFSYRLYRATQGISQYLSYRLFAPRCLLCDEAGQAPYDLCNTCAATLPWLSKAGARCAQPLANKEGKPIVCGTCQQRRGPLQHTYAAFIYTDPINVLLRRFKFHHDLAAGRLLVNLMAPLMASVMQSLNPQDRPQAFVPVPLHLSRLRQRGYDQALELAKPLARYLHIPLLHGLRRIRATQAQSQLDAATRKRNVHNAFVARGSLPAYVALIDDVMTTGATLQTAAHALQQAGVQRIDAWVCAHVP